VSVLAFLSVLLATEVESHRKNGNEGAKGSVRPSKMPLRPAVQPYDYSSKHLNTLSRDILELIWAIFFIYKRHFDAAQLGHIVSWHLQTRLLKLLKYWRLILLLDCEIIHGATKYQNVNYSKRKRLVTFDSIELLCLLIRTMPLCMCTILWLSLFFAVALKEIQYRIMY